METEILHPRQIDFNQDVEDEGCERLPVYLRVKPHDDDEEMSINILNTTTVETNHAYRTNKKATYTHVFPGSATQQEVFDGTSAHLIRKFLCGGNVMTFAYGVTSSGKTHTILGSHTDPGILPRTLKSIFDVIKSRIMEKRSPYEPTKYDEVRELTDDEYDEVELLRSALTSKVRTSTYASEQFCFENMDSLPLSMGKDGSPLLAARSCSVWISTYEIHNEVITDLFRPETRGKRKALGIGQDAKGRTYIKDLLHLPVRSASEAYALLQFARQNVATASTKLNDHSSRSHMIFNLKIVSWGGPLPEPFVNQLVISDLAGNERQAKTGTSGLTLRQAGAINQSLLVLGRCLEALRKNDKGIAAPFRESKLTRMLNPFFTQGGYVSLIICISPSIHLQDETMATIRLSAIASHIVQEPVRPLERLRRLRRLTLSCIDNSPMRVVDNAEIEHWQDAINGTSVHDGVTYLAVRASYFNDMARDILQAEKLLGANEVEIQSLKEKFKESEAAKENLKLMYQDKLKEQREKFAEQRRDLDGMHRETQQTLVEEFEEEIRNYKEKYLKYRNGYAKLSDYVKNGLWPEVSLFRERFGHLPEFPPKDGAEDEEAKPENTIKYWQDKVQEKEIEYRAMRTELHNKNDETSNLEKHLEDQKQLLVAVETELLDARRQSDELASRVAELNDQLATLTYQLSDREALVDEISDLKRNLQAAEEARESLVVEHQIRLGSVLQKFENLKLEVREKNSELEETRGALNAAQAELGILSSEGCKGETVPRSERVMLEEEVVNLGTDLAEQRKQNLELRENILSLEDKVGKFAGKEAELKEREKQFDLKWREARRSKGSENDAAQLMADLRCLRTALEDEREAFAAKSNLAMCQGAELERLRDRVTTLEALERRLLFENETMAALIEKSRGTRGKMKALQNNRKRLDADVKQGRQLDTNIKFLAQKENHQEGVVSNLPWTTEMNRRRRSFSASEVELKPHASGKPEERSGANGVEGSILAKTRNRPVFFYC